MKFNDLNDEQKQRAIEKHRDINVDYQEWNDSVQEEHHYKLKSVGFDGVQSQYSGFWTQGSGASFTADSLDIEKFLRAIKRWTYYRPLHEMIRINEIWAKVVRNSHQCYHEYTTQAELHGEHYIDLTTRQETLYEELEKEIDDYITNAGVEYYKALENEYNYLTSDEQVSEAIIGNELEFEEDPREADITYI